MIDNKAMETWNNYSLARSNAQLWRSGGDGYGWLYTGTQTTSSE